MIAEDETRIRQKSLQLISTYFEAMKRMDLETYCALWDEDAVVSIPLAEGNQSSDYQGLNSVIRPGMKIYFDALKTYDYTIDAIHSSLDPEIVIVEWGVIATVYHNSKEYKGKSITVFKMKNGKINHYKDYFNSVYFEIIADIPEA